MAQQWKIDVNEASREDLLGVPGVGEETADAILEFRENHGPIRNISELAEAEQINPRDIDSLREWLTAGSEGEEEDEEDLDEESGEGA